ncbi:MAG: tetratricopeptide repeat protein [Desulfotomaculales bacterium]
MVDQQAGAQIVDILEMARRAIELHDYNAARAFFRQIIAIDDACGAAWYGLGLIALWRGDVEEAYECLSEFVVLIDDKELAAEIESVLYYLERFCTGEAGSGLESLFAGLKRFQTRCLIDRLMKVGER